MTLRNKCIEMISCDDPQTISKKKLQTKKKERTSDSLNEGLPIKMTREKFQRKRYFSMKKIVGSTLDLSTKAVFSLDNNQLKNMG